jgi:hypothetical protein
MRVRWTTKPIYGMKVGWLQSIGDIDKKAGKNEERNVQAMVCDV